MSGALLHSTVIDRFGWALVALTELRDQRVALALGAKDGSLVARIRRLVEQDRPPRITSGGSVITVGLLLVALVAGGVWARSPDDQKDPSDVSEPPAEAIYRLDGLKPTPKAIRVNLKLDSESPAETIYRLDGLKPTPKAIRVNLKLDRNEFLLGESIVVEYEMTNIGEGLAPYDKGGFYHTLRINGAFLMTAVRVDKNGKPIGKPVDPFPMPQYRGGPVSNSKLKPGESDLTVLFVTRVLRFTQPGRYRLRVENVHSGTTTAYSSGETIVTLKQPTAKQARAVYEQKKRAPREAWNDNEMTFLKDAADFTTMHQPVYLPVLAEFLSSGDRDALLSLERMEGLAASQVLVDAITRALDRDDWQTARACFQHMKQSLPHPTWYDDPASDYYKKERARVALSWQESFRPALIRLAQRLTKAVASPANATKPRGDLAQKDGQALLRDIDYIYRCVGRDHEFEEFLKAFAISIEMTKTLPFETHQYFRPRGSAYGFQHTVRRMLHRAAMAPAKPSHPGEAAAFVMTMYFRPRHRPHGWQAEVTKWLKGDSPYLAELILDYLPEPIPKDALDYLPTALDDDYIDLQIAACKVAGRHPRADYKEPLKKIMATAKDEYLVKFAVEAARANGLKVQYDQDAPDVAPVLLEEESVN